MRYVSFLRHASLAPPFDDYDRLSLPQLDRLARQEVDPPINPEARISGATRSALHVDAAKTVFCATSLRARQTARLVSAAAEPTHLLDEIRFTPSRLVSTQEYKTRGMQAVREGLFDALITGAPGTEALADLYKRIESLQELLSVQPPGDILCITHGFYMRFLELYFAGGVSSPAGLTKNTIQAQTNHPNLHGFRVRLP